MKAVGLIINPNDNDNFWSYTPEARTQQELNPHDFLCHTCVTHTTESSERAQVMVTSDFGKGGESILDFGFSLNNVACGICWYP